jgi:hypothetical protein
MPLSGYVGVVASGNSLLVGESIASWSADFHLSHLSQFFRPSLSAAVTVWAVFIRTTEFTDVIGAVQAPPSMDTRIVAPSGALKL